MNSSKNVRMIIHLIVMLMIIPKVGFSQSNHEDIVGTWKVDIQESISRMDSEGRTRFDSLREEVKDRAAAAMRDREFIFETNGEVKIKWKNGDEKVTSIGKWEIDQANSSLSITVDEKSVYYGFKFIAQNELLLNGTANRGFFNLLFLTKK